MPIDFSLLSGEEFEMLCRDLLESLGVEIVEDVARGPDGKNDLIIKYSVKDILGRNQTCKLLVRCRGQHISNFDVDSYYGEFFK